MCGVLAAPTQVIHKPLENSKTLLQLFSSRCSIDRMTKDDVRAYLASIGRKGGKKSAKTRMQTLTPEQRSEIARHAVKARWAKEKTNPAKKRAAPKAKKQKPVGES